MISIHRMFASVIAAAALLSMFGPLPARADEPMPVVATFSVLGDMVRQVGGDRIALTVLVGPNGDTHVYQPTPADARAVRGARVLFLNGFGFEGWIERLIEASEFRGARVTVTDGIAPLPASGAPHGHGHGEDDHGDDDHEAPDPHAWLSLGNALIYVENVTAALVQADPAGARVYRENGARYAARIRALDAEIRELFSSLPEDRRAVVTSHDAFQYFGRAYGLTFLAPQGVSTEAAPSARDVAALIRQVRAGNVSALFLENVADPRLLERIAEETGASVGGTLYPGALSGPQGSAATYLDMVRHNARTLAGALAGTL